MSFDPTFSVGYFVVRPPVLRMMGAIARFIHAGGGGPRPSDSPLNRLATKPFFLRGEVRP